MVDVFLEDIGEQGFEGLLDGTGLAYAYSYGSPNFLNDAYVITDPSGYLTTTTVLPNITTLTVDTLNVNTKIEMDSLARIDFNGLEALNSTSLGDIILNSSLTNTASRIFKIGTAAVGKTELIMENQYGVFDVLYCQRGTDLLDRITIGSNAQDMVVLWAPTITRFKLLTELCAVEDAIFNIKTTGGTGLDPTITLDNNGVAPGTYVSLAGSKIAFGDHDTSANETVLKQNGDDYISITSGSVKVLEDLTIDSGTASTNLLMSNLTLTDVPAIHLNGGEIAFGKAVGVTETSIWSDNVKKISLEAASSAFGSTTVPTTINSSSTVLFNTNNASMDLTADAFAMSTPQVFASINSGAVLLGDINNQAGALEIHSSGVPVFSSFAGETYLDDAVIYTGGKIVMPGSAQLQFAGDIAVKQGGVSNPGLDLQVPFHGASSPMSGHVSSLSLYQAGAVAGVVDGNLLFPLAGQVIYCTVKVGNNVGVGGIGVTFDLYDSSDLLKSTIITIVIPPSGNYVISSSLIGSGGETFAAGDYIEATVGGGGITGGISIGVHFRYS